MVRVRVRHKGKSKGKGRARIRVFRGLRKGKRCTWKKKAEG
jgi:hypothetical protein